MKKIALGAAAAVLTIGAALGMGQAHADVYEQLGYTICEAVQKGVTADRLIDTLQQVKPDVSRTQAMALLTVTVRGFCPDETNKLLHSAS